MPSNLKSMLFFLVPKFLRDFILEYQKKVEQERVRKEQIKAKVLNLLEHKKAYMSCKDLINALRRLDGTVASEDDVWWAIEKLRKEGKPIKVVEQWGVELISDSEPQ